MEEQRHAGGYFVRLRGLYGTSPSAARPGEDLHSGLSRHRNLDASHEREEPPPARFVGELARALLGNSLSASVFMLSDSIIDLQPSQENRGQ